MGWDRGRYYTRSRKVAGRVVREYVGAGLVGELAAAQDENARAEREAARRAERAARAAEKARLKALDALVGELCALADLAARAVLVRAGYHLHHRGDWRKRRGRRGDEDEGDGG